VRRWCGGREHKGASALYARINHAAHTVCEAGDIRDLGAQAASKACQREAVAQAVHAVHSPQLAALVHAKTPGCQDVITFDEHASGAGESRGIVHFGFRLVSPADIDLAVEEVERACATWPEVAEWVARDPVLVIPVATLEDHGYHLPIDTDVVIAERREGTVVPTSDSLWLTRTELAPERWVASIDRTQMAASFSKDAPRAPDDFGAVHREVGRDLLGHRAASGGRCRRSDLPRETPCGGRHFPR
jgi:hypothetical protein